MIGLTTLAVPSEYGFAALLVLLAALASYVALREVGGVAQNTGSSASDAGGSFSELAETAGLILWQRDIQPEGFWAIKGEADRLLGVPVGAWIKERSVGTPGFWEEHIHAEERALVERHCAMAIENGTAQTFEHRRMGGEDEVRWFRTTVRSLGLTSGAVRLAGVTLDITDRRIIEERLRSELERITAELGDRMNAPLKAVPDNAQLLEESLRKLAQILDGYDRLRTSPVISLDKNDPVSTMAHS